MVRCLRVDFHQVWLCDRSSRNYLLITSLWTTTIKGLNELLLSIHHIPNNSWIFVSGTGWRSERLGFEKTISNPASFNPCNVRKKYTTYIIWRNDMPWPKTIYDVTTISWHDRIWDTVWYDMIGMIKYSTHENQSDGSVIWKVYYLYNITRDSVLQLHVKPHQSPVHATIPAATHWWVPMTHALRFVARCG